MKAHTIDSTESARFERAFWRMVLQALIAAGALTYVAWMMTGCAVAAGAAAGGAVGFVAGHEAGKDAAHEEVQDHEIHEEHD